MREFFPKNASAADIETWLGAGLHRGHIAYMPPLPLPEMDRRVLAEFLAEMIKLQAENPDQAAHYAVKGFPKDQYEEKK